MTQMTNPELFDRLGEPARIRHLAGYDLFHPGLRSELDRVAARSAGQLRAPVSMVSVLLDSAQMAIGSHGLPDDDAGSGGAPAEWSLCTHSVLTGNPFCLADSADDPVHATNPMLTLSGMRSYAGVPLDDGSGHVLGAHCVLDTGRRTFTEDDIAVLAEGATEVIRILSRYRLT